METRDEIVRREGVSPEVITVVRHIADDTAAALHEQLDAVAAAFHAARGDAAADHGAKFDAGISMARSCVDELARDHTLGKV